MLAIEQNRQGAGGYAIAFAAWFVFGVTDLIRKVPRNREPSAWLMKPGLVDGFCLIAFIFGIALAWH
jgi:hypothetical protein